VDELMKQGCKKEMALQFSALTLYDLVILLDDSSSMKYDEGGTRQDTLKQVLTEVASIYSLARPNGIRSVRFLNTKQGKKDVNPARVEEVLKVQYYGLTKIGTELKRKILNPFVLKDGLAMEKPVLAMIITDGDVEGEKNDHLETVIMQCVQKITADPKKGEHAVAFFFSRIGNDPGAKALIEGLDNHKSVREYIDCFPVNARLEDIKERDLKWNTLQKLLLGSLYAEVNNQDEVVADEEKPTLDVAPESSDDELEDD